MDGGPAQVAGPSSREIRWGWIALAALFVLAASVRLQLLDADYFSDEPMSYALSRHGFSAPSNVFDTNGAPTSYYVKSWYLERPGFYLAMTPAGQISFTAYRLEYILIASALAPLAVALLRALDVRSAFAYPVGLVVALHPQFFVWGAITHMDTPMTVALAAGFIANIKGRHKIAAFLFVLAVWTKETAMPFLVFVFVCDLLLEAVRERRLQWPLEFDGRRSAMFLAILLGFIPFMLAQEMGFGIPGEKSGGHEAQILDGLLLSLWFAPFILGGLLWTKTRPVAIWALGLPLFYLAVHVLFDWNVREWYLVASAFFALIAVAAFLDEAAKRLRGRAQAARWAPHAVGIALLLLIASLMVMPDSESKRQWANPLSQNPSFSIAETLEREGRRDLNGRGLLAALREAAPKHVLLVDVHYAFVQHPIPTFVDQVRNLDTNRVNGRVQDVRDLVTSAESWADLMVVGKKETQINGVVRAAYADCVVRDEPTYVFIDGQRCAGRFDRLYHELVLSTGAEA